jgi:hypothetical protein
LSIKGHILYKLFFQLILSNISNNPVLGSWLLAFYKHIYITDFKPSPIWVLSQLKTWDCSCSEKLQCHKNIGY